MASDTLFFHKEHLWVNIQGNEGYIGISGFAQERLGDIVFVELPEVGDQIEMGKSLGSIESVKTVSKLIAPLSGEIIEVNEEILDYPEKINEDPLGQGWLIKIAILKSDLVKELLNQADYESYLKELANE